MSQNSDGNIGDQTPHSYFVDETGDGVIFDSKGRILIGTGQVQDYFTLGMVECSTLQQLTIDLDELRRQLLSDPYFKGVPSLQPNAKKTALFFHAKDDLPEVRREVFRILQRHDFYFYAVVRTMSAVARGVISRNQRDPTYRYRPTELYDAAVRRLFDKKLHTQPAFEVIFASRGKARTRSIREHLLKAQKNSRKAVGTYPDAKIHVRETRAPTCRVTIGRQLSVGAKETVHQGRGPIPRTYLAESRPHRRCRRRLRKAIRDVSHAKTFANDRPDNKKSEGRGLSGEPTITRHGAEFHLPIFELYIAPLKQAT
ncbi:MAG: hypothetical protein ACKN94_12075 [Pirellulaceae bacterium]